MSFIFVASGLDPARPNFEGNDPEARLDKSDANFVDVIHTNSAPFLFGGAGYRGQLGHVDFYPNGGEHQPGCEGLLKCKNYKHTQHLSNTDTFLIQTFL